MGVPIIYNYDINSSVFLDSRRSIESLSMLEYVSSKEDILYPHGFEVFCIEEGAYYTNVAINGDIPIWKLRMIDDETPSFISTYSSQKISEMLGNGMGINDTEPSLTSVYSSQKVESVFAELRQGTTIVEDDLTDMGVRVDYLETRLWTMQEFDGSYNSLTDKPEIPSIEGLATEDFVRAQIANVEFGDINLEGYATEDFVREQISLIEIDVDLYDYARRDELPTKTSDLENDSNFISVIPSEYITEDELSIRGYLTKMEMKDEGYLTELEMKNIGYVTELEVENMGFLTEHQSLDEYIRRDESPTKTSDLENDSNFISSIPSEYITESELNAKGYLTEHQSLDGYARVEELHEHNNKAILDGITSYKINEWDGKSEFSGNYNDLTDKPIIPTVSNDLTHELKNNYDRAYAHSQSAHFSGDYNDLANKPDISSIEGYATKDYVDNAIDNIDITGELTEYARKTDIPIKVSQLDNDSNFLTEHQSLDEYAKKTELHTHNNKAVLDGITTSKVTEWDNKISKAGISLGIHTDGLLYIFINGEPVGEGIEL